ncbi:caltrin-like protein 2 [Spea bombifrons]|uniref:caltrin-like protein 2 n=1 Tax=Spea bombifrons TaxID=233779 RepID=UPI0023493BB3|nr:caltrin-like protein 2 [Spea bombifrons]
MNPVVVSLLLGLVLCSVGAQAQQGGEKPGRCPITPLFCQVPTPPDECVTDFGCTGNEKCCNYGCYKRCLRPQNE